MTKNKFFSIMVLMALILSLITPVFATESIYESDSVPEPAPLTLDAGAGVLMDADSGQLLFTQNAQEIMYPASTTKIMTALLTMKYCDPSAWVTLPEGIYQGIPDGASSAELKAGEEMTIYELLQCLMIVSANEAANALAIHISGSIEDFVALMNQEALDLGCVNTHFVNANGLHDENHYTTASDLARIAQAAMAYDTIVEICSSVTATIRETNLSEERTLKTTNYLLEGSDYPLYQYSGAFGMKTGFTTPAGCCLVSTAYVGEHTFLAVVLGAKKYEQDGENITGSFVETAKLLDWGIENYDTALVYQEFLATQPVETPSPSPSVTPTPTPSPTATPTPEPTQIPEPTPSPSPSSAPEPTPEHTVVPSPEPAPEQETTAQIPPVITQVSETLGVSVETLLLAVIAAAFVLLLVVVVVFVRIIKHSGKE